MSSKLEKACVYLCRNLVAVFPYQQEHFRLKLLQFGVMTIKFQPRQCSLPSLSTTSSIPFSSTSTPSCLTSTFRRLFKKISKNQFEIFSSISSVVSTLRFQSFALKTPMVVLTENLIVGSTLSFQSFGL